MKEENKKKVIEILKSSDGLTIQDLSDKTKLTRNTITIILAGLEGEGKLKIRKVGQAKLHYLEKKK